jgi:hypothetical protein
MHSFRRREPDASCSGGKNGNDQGGLAQRRLDRADELDGQVFKTLRILTTGKEHNKPRRRIICHAKLDHLRRLAFGSKYQ